VDVASELNANQFITIQEGKGIVAAQPIAFVPGHNVNSQNYQRDPGSRLLPARWNSRVHVRTRGKDGLPLAVMRILRLSLTRLINVRVRVVSFPVEPVVLEDSRFP
jgi:hypothetical protein